MIKKADLVAENKGLTTQNEHFQREIHSLRCDLEASQKSCEGGSDCVAYGTLLDKFQRLKSAFEDAQVKVERLEDADTKAESFDQLTRRAKASGTTCITVGGVSWVRLAQHEQFTKNIDRLEADLRDKYNIRNSEAVKESLKWRKKFLRLSEVYAAHRAKLIRVYRERNELAREVNLLSDLIDLEKETLAQVRQHYTERIDALRGRSLWKRVFNREDTN